MAPARPTAITRADKLRAISNLQSEITRRARSLRAEYARSAQSLRSKLEMRIYRIPKAMRQANMGQLLQKYLEMHEENGKPAVKLRSPLKESTRPVPAAAIPKPSPAKLVPAKKGAGRTKAIPAPAAETKPSKTANGTRAKGTKRNSDFVIAADNATDKENEAIENPKKRAKAGEDAALARPFKDPSMILSPKSNNSRTLPHSPVRKPFGVPAKGFSSRPASPMKQFAGPPSPVRQATVTRPATAAGTARTAATRATKATTASTRAGVSKAANRTASGSSSASTATTGTTIVRKGAASRAGTAASTAKKTTATAGTAASTRRNAATKAKTEALPAETGTRRVLRKR